MKTVTACLVASAFLISITASAQYSVDSMLKVRFNRSATTDVISEMHTGDFNKDGKIDVVLDGNLAMNQSGFIEFNSKPIFFLGDGRGKLVPTTSTFTHTGSSSFICDVADYNNDGYADILVADFWGNGMRLYKGAAGLNFTLAQNLPTGTHGAKGKFEDMDGDGDLDIVNVNSGSGAGVNFNLFNNTNGTFAKISYPSSFSNFVPLLYVLDVNNDGRKDIACISGAAGLLLIWIHNADGTYTFVNYEHLNEDMYDDINQRYTYWMDDVNADGLADLNFFYGLVGAKTSVSYGASTPPYFGPDIDLSGGDVTNYLQDIMQTVISGDVDNDHFKDIVTDNKPFAGPNEEEKQQLVVITDPLNRNGKFFVHTLNLGVVNENGPQSLKSRGYGLLLVDLDKDNDLELISAGIDDTLRIFNNATNAGPDPTAIRNVDAGQKIFNIYPNPSTDRIYLQMDDLNVENIQTVQIYDTKGALIQTIKGDGWKNGISTQSLAAGTYMLSLKMKNGEGFAKLFSKK